MRILKNPLAKLAGIALLVVAVMTMGVTFYPKEYGKLEFQNVDVSASWRLRATSTQDWISTFKTDTLTDTSVRIRSPWMALDGNTVYLYHTTDADSVDKVDSVNEEIVFQYSQDLGTTIIHADTLIIKNKGATWVSSIDSFTNAPPFAYFRIQRRLNLTTPDTVFSRIKAKIPKGYFL